MSAQGLTTVELNGYDALSTPSPPHLDIETIVIGPLKIWHLSGIGLFLIFVIVVVVCCRMDVRVPRTRQSIENTYRRRKLHDKYGEKFIDLSPPSLEKVLVRDLMRDHASKASTSGGSKRGRASTRQRISDLSQHSPVAVQSSSVEDSVPLSRDPTRWLGAINKLGNQNIPRKNQVLKALSSLKPVDTT
ncbi:uncharacterized protein LOC110459157 isoform X2 [Mizuhopecten yessoensis]|uniref:uncharacterized protein LOC110459157 isoform X2 n=1 Tax=Mizuhopecten yessoensis TaxID=6573 RepID=UPI000B45C2D0|nr:uncharacterized protein LOC110459157 isoform X2 [Mizuhopecten yessoensis]